ncbi:transglycosylase SLT domain-containing protein [Polymorphobacter fuscus]|uniref:Transglycosylase SLT domain-containing protein n=1 Tax=Sandarakinorhabdus fusca TaxID=1439888 RepID=A0A7C9KJC9_9SPHN|nr:transglycosylase SLT domain-containing protein [Polymorphobacter fuscus]KAB7648237.1 transglycosylase SLT domain-containing protein [Polymorphobacter fuscus]MQT15743.1 transglycosylase SLT domain-containing protein [Polymorphobacter fuscus]NJC07986.1 hypothetical protein [Polymorphobacter fuscus]
MDFAGTIAGISQGVGSVATAVREAAERTGVDFSYLMAQARVESGLNPQAQARTSSARGLYQFTSSTWLDTVRKHGAAHGLGWAAEAIASGAAKAGSATRETILALRDNAEAAALMAGEFARDNGHRLEATLGRAMGSTDLYMAHFLGVGGAAKFLGALASVPNMAAATLLPAAAAANRGVFFDKDGSARSVAEVYARFETKLGAGAAGDAPLPARENASPTSPRRGEVRVDAAQARLAYMLLAALS